MVLSFPDGVVTLNATSSTDEGNDAQVCVSITSSATGLGCDLTVDLSTSNGKAGK